MRIGVVAIQGDIEEHIIALERTLAEREAQGEVVRIKHRGPSQVLRCPRDTRG